MTAHIWRRVSWMPSFSIVFSLSLLLRLFFIALTDPILKNDSFGYMSIARQIPDLTYDDGSRTPIYPLFVAMFQVDPSHVRLAQMSLGLLTTAGLFWLGWHLTRNNWISALCGASYGLNVAQIQNESEVATEALAACLLILSIAVVLSISETNRSIQGKYLLLGILVTLAALTRPMLAFMPVLVLVALVAMKRARRNLWIYLVVGFIPILAWCTFNQVRFGMFGLTTITGYNLTDHSGKFIEYAPDQYAYIKQPYLNKRNDHGGDAHNVIWLVEGQIRRSTGQSVPELSKTLTQMSLTLFAQHPTWYLESVGIGWAEFWNTTGFTKRCKCHGSTVSALVDWIGIAEKVFVVGVNLVFVLLSPVICVRYLAGKAPATDTVATASAIVWASSIVQAAFESGEAGRYSIPLQPLMALVVFVVLPSFQQAVSTEDHVRRWLPSALWNHGRSG